LIPLPTGYVAMHDDDTIDRYPEASHEFSRDLVDVVRCDKKIRHNRTYVCHATRMGGHYQVIRMQAAKIGRVTLLAFYQKFAISVTKGDLPSP
jgi:hypothetical protein